MSLATHRHLARPLAAALALVSVSGLGACAASDREPAAQTLTVFAASSLKVPFEELATTFEADNPGVRVSFNFAGSTDLVAQLKEGATAQVLATADSTSMQGAAEEGLLDGEAEIFATNHLVIAVPADNPAGISTFADLAKKGVRLVMCAPDCPRPRPAGGAGGRCRGRDPPPGQRGIRCRGCVGQGRLGRGRRRPRLRLGCGNRWRRSHPYRDPPSRCVPKRLSDRGRRFGWGAFRRSAGFPGAGALGSGSRSSDHSRFRATVTTAVAQLGIPRWAIVMAALAAAFVGLPLVAMLGRAELSQLPAQLTSASARRHSG